MEINWDNISESYLTFKEDDEQYLQNYYKKCTDTVIFTKLLIRNIINLFEQLSYNILYQNKDDTNINEICINIHKKTLKVIHPSFIDFHLFIKTVIFTYEPFPVSRVISSESDLNTKFKTSIRDINSTYFKKIIITQKFDQKLLQKCFDDIIEFHNSSI